MTAIGPPAAAAGEERRTDDSLRRDDDALLWLLDLLAPIRPDVNGPVRHYGVLPRAETPRYLLPLHARRATKRVMLRPGTARSAKQAVLRTALTTMLRLGLLPLVKREVTIPDGQPGSPSLLQWLEGELGEDHLVMSLAIGPPRPNRKPVLQLLTPDGRTVCFAKMAVDEHTARLVRNEHAFLAAHRPKELVVPEALSLRHWKGHEIALYSALSLAGDDGGGDGAAGGSGHLQLTKETLLDITRLLPLERAIVVGSPWWSTVEGRAQREAGPHAGKLSATVRRLACRLEGVTWTFGAWHGDLTQWNARWVNDRLNVWDWERAGGPVPVGFDAVHCEYQVATLADHQEAADAARRTSANQGELLAAVGIPADEHRLLVDCYLMELALRCLDGARSGSLGAFDRMVPGILAHLARDA